MSEAIRPGDVGVNNEYINQVSDGLASESVCWTMAVKQCYYLIVTVGLAAVVISQNPIDERTTFEAAFQGKFHLYYYWLSTEVYLIKVDAKATNQHGF